MKPVYSWESGQPHSVDKKLFILVSLWELLRPVNRLKFVMDFGKSLTGKSLIIG